MLINISHGDVIVWSTYSFPQEKYSHSELRWQRYSLNGTVEISSTVDEPSQWHGIGTSGPILQFDNSIQTDLWESASALCHLKLWNERLNVYDGEYTLSFKLNQGHTLIACVLLPYILLKGPIQWHPNNYSITYEHCALHACIDANILLDVTSESLHILRASPAIWIPVKLLRLWQD